VFHVHRLDRRRKKSCREEKHTAAAEAAIDFAALTARLEAAPLQNNNQIRVFPPPSKQESNPSFSAACKAGS
jgi:hypothetical protein